MPVIRLPFFIALSVFSTLLKGYLPTGSLALPNALSV